MKDLKGGNFAYSDPTPNVGLERWGSDRHPDREQVPEKNGPNTALRTLRPARRKTQFVDGKDM